MLQMTMGKDDTKESRTDPLSFGTDKSHSLKEKLAYKRHKIRTLTRGREATGKLSRSEGLEKNMVYILILTLKV